MRVLGEALRDALDLAGERLHRGERRVVRDSGAGNAQTLPIDIDGEAFRRLAGLRAASGSGRSSSVTRSTSLPPNLYGAR